MAATLALLTASAPASRPSQPTPNRFCKNVHTEHGIRGVDGYGPRCRFMRKWTIQYMNSRIEPPGWSCVNLGDSGGCDKRHSSAYVEWYKLD